MAEKDDVLSQLKSFLFTYELMCCICVSCPIYVWRAGAYVCVCLCIAMLVMTFPEWLKRYGTIAAHTRRSVSVLVFVVLCVHMYSFAGLIRLMPPPTFSDTAITDRHSDTTIFQLRAHWVQISWSIGSKKLFGHVPLVGIKPSTFCLLCVLTCIMDN